MTYSQQLYELPTTRLREIVRRRAATLEGIPRTGSKRELAEFLAAALSQPGSIAQAIDATDLLQLELLVYVIAQDGEAPFEQVVREAGEEAREGLRSAIQGLEALGLMFESERGGVPRVVVPQQVRQQVELPPPLQLRLTRSLPQYDVPTLLRIGENLGVHPPPPPSKQALIAAIIAATQDPRRLAERVARLPAEAHHILESVLQQGGVASLYDVAARLDSRQRSQVYTYDWHQRWSQGKPRNAVEVLLGHALLVMEAGTGWGYGRLAVPAEALQAITGRRYFTEGVHRAPAWETVPASANGQGSPTHSALCRDIAYFLGSLGRTDATRTGKGTIHRSVLKTLAKGLTIPTPSYAGFVYALSREADLIAPQQRGAIYDVTTRGLAWLDQEPAAQTRILAEIWRAQMVWAEMLAEPLNDGGIGYEAATVRFLRDAVIELLAELARERPGEMASVRSLARRAHYRWWRRFGSPDAGAGGQDGQQEGVSSALELIRRIAAESLFWLGLAEVGPSADRPACVRLSALGRHILMGEDGQAQPDTQESFVVQPNMEIYAPPNLHARLLYRLFRNTEPSGNGMLVLSRESLRRALDRGESARGFLQFLHEHSSTGVPQNVEYMVQEVSARHGHIRVGHAGLYLQVSDPVLLKELKAQKKLGIHFRSELADTVALITGESEESVLRALRQAGYFPVGADDTPRTAAPQPTRARRQWKPPQTLHTTRDEVDVRIDWAAVAADDDTPWAEPHRASADGAPVTDARGIRRLIERACASHGALEITYHPAQMEPPSVRVIEPQSLDGNMLRAYCRLRQDRRTFNVLHIRSARAADNGAA